MEWYVAPCVTLSKDPEDEFDTTPDGTFPATDSGSGLAPMVFPGSIVPVYDLVNNLCLVGLPRARKVPSDWDSKTLGEAKTWFQDVKSRAAGLKEVF